MTQDDLASTAIADGTYRSVYSPTTMTILRNDFVTADWGGVRELFRPREALTAKFNSIFPGLIISLTIVQLTVTIQISLPVNVGPTERIKR